MSRHLLTFILKGIILVNIYSESIDTVNIYLCLKHLIFVR